MPETPHNTLVSYGRQAITWQAALRKTLLVILPLAAGLALAPLVYDRWHHRPVREVHKHLARVRNAVVVSTWETDYGARGSVLVSEVSLHVRGRTDAWIQLYAVDPDAFVDAKHLYLCRLGNYEFHVENFDGTYSATDYCINIGAEGDFAHLIPFRVRNVQDVVDRYDDLVAVISKWPRHPNQARLEKGPGKGSIYSVKE